MEDKIGAPEVHGQRQGYQAGQIESQYKVLTLTSCNSCHNSTNDIALGFNYLQLSGSAQKVNIFSLKAQDLFNSPPLFADEIKGSAAAKSAIGYMQTNCATCHDGIAHRMNFEHVSGAINYPDENVVKEINAAAVSGAAPLVTYGNLSASSIYQRVLSGNMPKVQKFTVDPEAVKVLSDWIMETPPSP